MPIIACPKRRNQLIDFICMQNGIGGKIILNSVRHSWLFFISFAYVARLHNAALIRIQFSKLLNRSPVRNTGHEYATNSATHYCVKPADSSTAVVICRRTLVVLFQ